MTNVRNYGRICNKEVLKSGAGLLTFHNTNEQMQLAWSDTLARLLLLVVVVGGGGVYR